MDYNCLDALQIIKAGFDDKQAPLIIIPIASLQEMSKLEITLAIPTVEEAAHPEAIAAET